MSPVSLAAAELLVAVQRAEVRAKAHLEARRAAEDQAAADSDHQCAVAGDLADALDRIHPGLGLRFMNALHPHLDLSLDEDLDVLDILQAMRSPGLTQ